MTKLELYGKKISLKYSALAQEKMYEEMQGDIGTLKKYLGMPEKDAEGNPGTESEISQSEIMNRLCKLICILADAAAYEHNFMINCGFSQGENWTVLPIEFFKATMQFHDMPFYSQAIMSTIQDDSAFIIPSSMKAEEEDEYLKEYETQKNQSDAVEKTDSESFTEDSTADSH